MNQRLKNKYKIIIKKEKSKYCNIIKPLSSTNYIKKKKKKMERRLGAKGRGKQVDLEKVVIFQDQEAEGN